MQHKDRLVQSWSNLFPQELVERHDLDTPEKRSIYFYNLWEQWDITEIDLSKYKRPHEIAGGVRYSWYLSNPVREFAQKHNLKEFWDYQLRMSKVRFKDMDMALLFRLSI